MCVCVCVTLYICVLLKYIRLCVIHLGFNKSIYLGSAVTLKKETFDFFCFITRNSLDRDELALCICIRVRTKYCKISIGGIKCLHEFDMDMTLRV